ncbi:MAG: hypothetical protein EXR05_05575 [Acetobacteraceae bacterium]|nr:hypothetical protein [Acetobacteraceae bacterium]
MPSTGVSRFKFRKGSVVGLPRFSTATSTAATGLCHVLNSLIKSLFADLAEGFGSACCTIGNPVSCPDVIIINLRDGHRAYAN